MFNNHRTRKPKIKFYTLICPQCGVEFQPFRGNQRFCTSDCTKKFHMDEYRKSRELLKQEKEKSA